MIPDRGYVQTNDDLRKSIDPNDPEFFEVITPYWQEDNSEVTVGR